MSYLSPNTPFSISGSNLNFIRDVKFGESFVTDLELIGATGISGTVPLDAYTQEILALTSHGTFSLGVQDIILTTDDQVLVGTLPSISGAAGNIFTISGENFYQITNVKFGDVESSFQLVDPNTIESVVPQDADYRGVTVFSSLRTGLNGNQTLASGLSVDEFVPIPAISGLNSYQLASGESLFITGFSLSGVTGIRFAQNNNLIAATTLSPNTVTAIVPSGNIRGKADLLLQSGQVSPIDDFPLSPLARITGTAYSTVGVNASKPAGSTGTLLLVSGENFTTGILYKTGSNYLGSIMGQTGEFKLISDTLVSGLIPTGIPIATSGGNVGISPEVSSGLVTLFSDNYPESYPSESYFTPTIGLPKITSITPSSGIQGDTVTIKGNDLYGITGVNFTPYSNVGIGTYDAGSIAEISPGFELAFEIGSAASLGSSYGESFDMVLSGFYGSVTGENIFFVFGNPTVSSVTPSIEVVPGVTGLFEGTCLYSGTTLELWTGTGPTSTFKYYSNLPVSGYDLTNHDVLKFQYPASFETGIEYRLRARNRRSASPHTDADSHITVLSTPFISGFEPLSGEFGEVITVSGHLENIVESGLSVGLSTVSDFTQTGTTGFRFTIPPNTQSDLISIATSGGFVESTGFLSVTPSAPDISGYYSGVRAPNIIDYEQVFAEGDRLTISGARMNLVTGVRFSGQSGSLDFSNFVEQNYSVLGLEVPNAINGASGKFQLLDSLGRVTDSNPTGINLISVSGFDNYLAPAETMKMTGYNISGMDFLFVSPTGGYIKTTAHSTTLLSDGAYALETQVPTGIIEGDIRVTGRSNAIDSNPFYPVGVVTGMEGLNLHRQVSPNTVVSITGINSFDPNIGSVSSISESGSGVKIVGFSGWRNPVYPHVGVVMAPPAPGYEEPFGIKSYSTGTATIGGVANTFYTKIEVEFPREAIETGTPFIIDPWWTQSYISTAPSVGTGDLLYTPSEYTLNTSYADFQLPSPTITGAVLGDSDLGAPSHAYSIVDKKLSFYGTGNGGSLAITGDSFCVTGFHPVTVQQGGLINLSGQYLDRVTGYNLINGQNREPSQYVSGNSNEAQVALPYDLEFVGENFLELVGDGVSTYASHLGMTSSGVRNSDSEPALIHVGVRVGTEGINYNIISTGAMAPAPPQGSTTNYTMEENVGGIIFLVTRTKFPDGTTMLVSSIPKS
jgi:hypothetical protein